MGKRKENVCPGCSRHCTADHIRCKRGRIYFEKQREQTQTDTGWKRYKWEKYVMPEETLWKLLRMSARLKKSLKHGEITEAQILRGLTEEEKASLTVILDKMEKMTGKCNEDV